MAKKTQKSNEVLVIVSVYLTPADVPAFAQWLEGAYGDGIFMANDVIIETPALTWSL